MSRLWILLHLVFLSAQDLKEGQLSMLPVLELGAAGLLRAALTGRTVSPWIGLLLLGFGWLSGEQVGYGDGWLLAALGMWIGWREQLHMLMAGMLLCAAAGLFLRRRELPFVPFLTAAYVVMLGVKG